MYFNIIIIWHGLCFYLDERISVTCPLKPVQEYAMIKKLTTALMLAAVFGTSAAYAAPIIFFGENQTPGGTVSGDPLTAHNTFVSNLSGVGSEGFESYASGTGTPRTIAFPGSSGSITATLNGNGNVENLTSSGRFNTTPMGRQWWEVSGMFDIAFGQAISAFGFYGTDIGDFNGQITLALTDINGIVTNLVVPNTVNGRNASLLFYGFIDSGNSYTSIAFGNTNAGTDFFGFDDMIIGDSRQVSIPEPATLALLGLGLIGLATARRNKTKAA